MDLIAIVTITIFAGAGVFFLNRKITAKGIDLVDFYKSAPASAGRDYLLTSISAIALLFAFVGGIILFSEPLKTFPTAGLWAVIHTAAAAAVELLFFIGGICALWFLTANIAAYNRFKKTDRRLPH